MIVTAPLDLDHRARHLGGWVFAMVWVAPAALCAWTAFHPPTFAARFVLTAPLTFENFARVWHAAPFARYFLNSFLLVTFILASQLMICTLAAYAFVSFPFGGSELPVSAGADAAHDHAGGAADRELPDARPARPDRHDLGMGLPYLASAFGIFLIRQTFKSVPKELEEAARLEGGERPCRRSGGCSFPSRPDADRLRLGDGQLSLEQFSVAAGRFELGRHSPDHGRPAGLRDRRAGRRLEPGDGGYAAVGSPRFASPSSSSSASSCRASCARVSAVGRARLIADPAYRPCLRLPCLRPRVRRPRSCATMPRPAPASGRCGCSSLTGRLDGVVLTGDLTDGGSVDDYRLLRTSSRR